jgi:Tfp pilus assembly protein PilF
MWCERYKLSFLWIVIACFTAEACAQRIVTQRRQLHVQVLNQDNHGLLAKVTLRNDETLDLVTYTDRTGNADFYGIPAGNYVLIVTVGGTETHRDQISLLNTEGSRSELVRLNLPSNKRGRIVQVDELTIPKAAKEYYDAGMEAVGGHNWAKARAGFNDAVTTYPRYARAFNALGVVLAITAQLNEAESAFRRAIELNPQFAEPHSNLGKLLLESNRAPEARKELERSLKLGAGTSSTIELLVESMILTHDEDSAVSFVRSLHLKNIAHAPGLHLEIGSALESSSKGNRINKMDN